MNVAKRMAISALARIKADKLSSLERWAMTNVFGRSPEELRTLHENYALAEAEYRRACVQLERAQMDYAEE